MKKRSKIKTVNFTNRRFLEKIIISDLSLIKKKTGGDWKSLPNQLVSNIFKFIPTLLKIIFLFIYKKHPDVLNKFLLLAKNFIN